MSENRERAPRLLVVGGADIVDEVVDPTLRSAYGCEFAPDAESALRLSSWNRFGAVVLLATERRGAPDLELLVELVAGQPEAAVVVVSWTADPALADRALAVGAHDYLVLPLSPRQLRDLAVESPAATASWHPRRGPAKTDPRPPALARGDGRPTEPGALLARRTERRARQPDGDRRRVPR